MTSSLVGSEMCIRDRKYMLDYMSQVLPTHIGGLDPMTNHLEMAKAIRKSCLLYTSDAADDM
eukprot:8477195-Prorocentrum_lima.AAC.1